MIGMNDPNLQQSAEEISKRLVEHEHFVTKSDKLDSKYRCVLRAILQHSSLTDSMTERDTLKIQQNLETSYRWDEIRDWHVQYDVIYNSDGPLCNTNKNLSRSYCMPSGFKTEAATLIMSLTEKFVTPSMFVAGIQTTYEKLYHTGMHHPNTNSDGGGTSDNCDHITIQKCELAVVRVCKEYVLNSLAINGLVYIYRVSKECRGSDIQDAEKRFVNGEWVFRVEIVTDISKRQSTYEVVCYCYLSLLLKIQDILYFLNSDKTIFRACPMETFDKSEVTDKVMRVRLPNG